MAVPLAALPPAYRERARAANPVVVGAGLWAIGALVAFGALVGAYTTLRAGSSQFFPVDYKKTNYMPSCMVAGAGMLMVFAEWLVWAVRNSERRQVTVASLFNAGMLLAMVNGGFYEVRVAGFAAGGSVYGVFFYAFVIGSLLLMIAALAALAVHAARFAGRQVSAFEPDLARATSIVLHTASISWIIVWGTLFAATK